MIGLALCGSAVPAIGPIAYSASVRLRTGLILVGGGRPSRVAPCLNLQWQLAGWFALLCEAAAVATPHTEVWVDASHAGCLRTRKSTSGCSVILGGACTLAYSRTQAVIALSSSEAEYYSLVSGTSSALGEASMLKDWQVCITPLIWWSR